MKHMIFIWCLIAASMSGVIGLGAELGTEAYRFTLVEPYAIYRAASSQSSLPDRKPYQLVEVLPAIPGVGLNCLVILPDVEQIGIKERVIYGKAKVGLFILDARKQEAQPEIFGTSEAWQTALRTMGVAEPGKLSTPDALAAAVPAQTLRPGNRPLINARVSISADVCAGLVQMLGLAVAFVAGMRRPLSRLLLISTVLLGVAVNVVAGVLIGGGGPEAFVGFIVLPVLCILAAAGGRGLRLLLKTRRRTDWGPEKPRE